MRLRFFPVAILVLFLGFSCSAKDELYDGFQSPPSSARPFVRWWWNGNRVMAEETLRELDVMKEAGIGGFEMNTIVCPNATQESLDKTTPLAWLSPEWNEVVRATSEGARQRGMIPDLIVGSGWPFGGRFLESGEQIQIVTANKKELEGPGVFRSEIEGLTEGAISLSGEQERRKIESGSKAKLVFLRLVPAGIEKFEAGKDMMDCISSEGVVEFDIPQGKYVLYAGAWREGYREVTHGVAGADGPALNHLNRDAVRKYLTRMSDALNPVMGGSMSNYLRAMFCDSLELGHTNWTDDIASEFEKRRGYDASPYLHYMVDMDVIEGETESDDMRRRLRYDFNITVIELFMERFMKTYTQWCNENGLKSRAQSYGRESHPLDTSFLVDIPECETWLWGADKTSHPCTINRYVASAAHLAGKTEVSCEAMTNTVTVFRILPKDIKRTDDLNFISGVTHSVLHGFNYSPEVADFPGWVQFGCYFSEQNSWWPYFRKWADYNARISWVLQNSKAQARVAILTPDADIWSTVGRPYHPFAEREAQNPWYLYELWKAFHQNGHNAEFVSDKILGEATFEGGKINFGPRAYDVLLLEDVKSILPGTAKQLEMFAKAGGKIIFINQAPYRNPSFKDAQANDTIVKESIKTALDTDGKRVAVVEAPKNGKLVDWAGEITERFEIEPDVQISAPNADLSQIYHKAGGRDIFFITWTNVEDAIDFSAKFNVEDKIPYVWNPETGERFRFSFEGKGNILKIHLEPQQSLLLVFEAEEIEAPLYKTTVADLNDSVEIAEPWQVECTHVVTKDKFTMQLEKLADFGQSDKEKLNRFAGVINYHTTFEAEDLSHTMIDLGTVHGISEVKLNGIKLGVCWYGRSVFDGAGVLKTGENILEVKVTTHLGNYVRGFGKDTPAGRYSWWYPVEPAGILGPVKFCKRR